MFEQLHM